MRARSAPIATKARIALMAPKTTAPQNTRYPPPEASALVTAMLTINAIALNVAHIHALRRIGDNAGAAHSLNLAVGRQYIQ